MSTKISSMLLTFLTACCFFPSAVWSAETIIANGNGCSLADAILSANAGFAVGGCTSGSPGPDVIVLDYDVVLNVADTVNSTFDRGVYAGLPEISSPITLQAGSGAIIERDSKLGCDSDSSPFRLLHVSQGGALLLQGITLRGGCAASSVKATSGGAILVNSGGVLNLDGCNLENNISWSKPGSVARGGAISIGSSILASVVGTVFRNNLSQAGEPTSTSRGEAYGGAIAVFAGTLGPISTSEFLNNEVRGGQSANFDGGKSFGGAISLEGGSADTVKQTLFAGNTAVGGDSNSSKGGSARGGAFFARDAALKKIQNSWFSHNESHGGNGDRGGQGSGGGLQVSGSSTLDALTATTFSANRALSGDGGSNGKDSRGGGVYLTVDVAEIANNTFLRNQSIGGNHLGNGNGGHGTGGGLRTTKAIENFAHNTFSGNVVIGGHGTNDGLGLGRGVYGGSRTIVASNSVFWADAPSDQDVPVSSAACWAASFVSAGYNLVDEPGNCAFDGPSDVLGADPLFSGQVINQCAKSLLDGTCPPVLTIDPTSLALDQGSCATSGMSIDARGMGRPFDEIGVANADDGCDIGAYEWSGPFSPGPPGPCDDCDLEK